jgi:alpha/beta superfamily hydrolase
MTEIRSTTELPARRRDIELTTADGHVLVGELCLPENAEPVGTVVFLHPLPTAGGYMDSHIIRKAALRLPAMANIAVLRFNFRGVSSPRGTSQGVFGEGIEERFDFLAAVDFVRAEGLPTPWIVGWSFGTEVALNHGHTLDIAGLILLAPPLHRTGVDALERWNDNSTPIVAVIPEFDDYLKPAEARERFAVIPRVDLVTVDEGRHLWVGEKQTYRVLSEIVERVNPAALPLPTTWP